MTTIFFGEFRPGPSATGQGAVGRGTAEAGIVLPVAPVSCSAIVVCHLAGRRRMTKP
ncbi:hypothetical protein [Methylobacterium platani]|uniref:hypothetical protein n=1 Tax=Methylobacterium platani TaxID=427683 RepID=UPI0012E941B3|nr:hypothetical protein [Methylobacterium platani]